MKQALNKVKIEGILSEVDLKLGEAKTDKKPYIMGEIKVRVQQEINGEVVNTEIPVNLFSTQFTKEGKLNPAYVSIKKVMDEFTSIAAAGSEDGADRVRITSGEINANEFYTPNGDFVSYPRVRASFVSKIKKEECRPEATFDMEIVVAEKKMELTKDAVETGRLIVKGIIVQYGDKIDVVNFIVSSAAAIEHIEAYWDKKDTVNIAGKVNFTSHTDTVSKPMGFGDPVLQSKTTTLREIIITSGSSEVYGEEVAYSDKDITDALLRRSESLLLLKNKASGQKAVDKTGF